jgi:hypothetical protein
MQKRSFLLAALAALFFFFASTQSNGAPAPPESCTNNLNIQTEIGPENDALISWKAVAQVFYYKVQVYNSEGNVVFNEATNQPKVHVNNLNAGEAYAVNVCYECPSDAGTVCSESSFYTIIIEDLIVMLDGRACSCNTPVGGNPQCTGQPLYPLNVPAIYNIQLGNGDKQVFVVDNGKVNPVGNCNSPFKGLGATNHGSNNTVLPYFDLGSVRIYFHGTQFCIQADPLAVVTTCGNNSGNTEGRFKHPQHSQEHDTDAWVFPNPFQDMLQLRPEKAGATLLRCYDARGQMILEQPLPAILPEDNPVLLPAAHWAPGLYWLEIRYTDGQKTQHRAVKI